MMLPPAIDRVRFDQLRPLYDALDMIRGADPPTLRGALDYLGGGRIAYGAHGHEMNLRVLQWAAKWARAGVTLEAVRERIRRGYNPRRNPTYFRAAWPAKRAGYETTGILRRVKDAVAAIPADSRTGAYIFQTEAPSAKLALRKSLWGQWWKRPLEWVVKRNPGLVKWSRGMRANSGNVLSRGHRRHRRYRPLPPPRRVDRPRHFHWNPDAEVMRHALAGYQARGQRVLLGHPDMDMKARVEKQLTGGPGALFTIRLEDPIGQEDYEAALGLYGGQARKVFEQAVREGRVNGEGRLARITVPWAYLSLDVGMAPRGSLVEYQTEDPYHVSSMRDTPGRIVMREDVVGRGGEMIYSMELFEPLNMWQLPPGVAMEHGRPGYWSKTAYFLDDSSREALAGARPDILARFGPMKRIESPRGAYWALDEPKPLAEAMRLVEPLFGAREAFRLGGMWTLYFILPLWFGGSLQGGHFRPMREDLAKGLELEVFEGAEWLEGLA